MRVFRMTPTNPTWQGWVISLQSTHEAEFPVQSICSCPKNKRLRQDTVDIPVPLKKVFFTLCLALAFATGGAYAYLHDAVEKELGQFVNNLARQGIYAAYTRFNFTLSGQLHLHDVKLKFPAHTGLDAKQLVIHRIYRYYQGIPPTWRVDLLAATGIIPIRKPLSPALFKALGYADYYLSGQELDSLGYRNNPADISLSLSRPSASFRAELQVDIKKMGKATLQAESTKTISILSDLADWQKIPLQQMRLVYTDQGLLQSVKTYLAKRNGISPEQLAQRLYIQLTANLQAAGIDLQTKNSKALQTFFKHPASLDIRLHPTAAFTLWQLAKYPPADWVALTGLQIQP